MIVGAARLFPLSSPPITDGGFLIADGRIEELGEAESLRRKYPSVEYRHHGDCILMPGLVNSHTHLEYSVFAHLARETSFLPWIRKLVRLADIRTRFWGPSYWEKAAAIGIGKSLKAGITCVGDIVTFGGSLGAARRSRIRMRAFLEAVALDGDNLPSALRRLRRQLDTASNWSGTVTPGLSPHSIYTLSPAALVSLGDLAAEYDLPLAIHAGETSHEGELLGGRGPLAGQISRYGLPFGAASTATLTGYLKERGALTPTTLLVHGVHLGEEDLRDVARQGAGLVTCPRSNRLLGAGVPPYRLWSRLGIPFAYGTDSLASVPDFDLFQEARVVRDQLSESGDAILRRLTLGGAEAIGLGDVTGSIAAGKFADFILLEFDNPRGCTAENIINSASPSRVAATIVGGRTQYRSLRLKVSSSPS